MNPLAPVLFALKHWRAVAVLALLTALALWHWRAVTAADARGYDRALAEVAAETAKTQTELDALKTDLAARVVEIAEGRRARERLAQELEDEARRDPLAPSRKPSADSLRRLRSQWGDRPAP